MTISFPVIIGDYSIEDKLKEVDIRVEFFPQNTDTHIILTIGKKLIKIRKSDWRAISCALLDE